MLELTPFFNDLAPVLGSNVGVFTEIVKGIYRISGGGVTMKNISRWTLKGCGYRTIQRFFSSSINWLGLNILLFQTAYFDCIDTDKERYVLALDETVEDKAGKKTHGVNWFYSSIAAKVIRSISSHVISIIDTKKEKSFVLTHEQTIKPVKKTKRKKVVTPKKSKKGGKKDQNGKKRKSPGRPKGSKNKQNVKSEGLLYNSFEKLLTKVLPLLQIIGLNIGYVLGDGAYGNKTCCLIAMENGLNLISKLNRNTGLYLPYSGVYSGRGRKKKYGDRINYQKIPVNYLTSSSLDDGIKTYIYQIKGVWTKHIPCLLNVVIIVKTDVATEKSSRVVLFSTDVNLSGTTIIRFYSLRFQIEFNFRDAKQYFGLSDFKNIKEKQVNNAIGLSLFMDNFSLVLAEKAKEEWKEENVSILDLKAYFRAEKYLHDILNTLEIAPNTILNEDTFVDIMKIGAINRTKELVLTS